MVACRIVMLISLSNWWSSLWEKCWFSGVLILLLLAVMCSDSCNLRGLSVRAIYWLPLLHSIR